MAVNSGFSHWTWWFSIVMLNYQRVMGISWNINGESGPLGVLSWWMWKNHGDSHWNFWTVKKWHEKPTPCDGLNPIKPCWWLGDGLSLAFIFHDIWEYMGQSSGWYRDGSSISHMNNGIIMGYHPLVNVYSLRHRKWPIETVDLPSYKIVIFHSYGNVCQRVRQK